jgi:hypothetical protein
MKKSLNYLKDEYSLYFKAPDGINQDKLMADTTIKVSTSY